MKTQRVRFVALGVSLAFAMTGCARDPVPVVEEPEVTESSAAADDTQQSSERPARVTLKVTGAHQVDWQGEQTVKLIRAGAPGDAVNLLSVSVLAPQPIDDPAVRVRWGFDVLGQYLDQPGSFVLPPNAEHDPAKPPGGVVLVYLKAKDPDVEVVTEMSQAEDFAEYRTMVQGCTIEVAQGALSGTLSCPELSDGAGRTAGLWAQWEFLR